MTFEKLKNYLDGLKDEYKIPFCQCRITENGKTVFDYYAGDRHEDKALYYIYSMTKLITAVAAMRLVESGKISLDENIEKYLPEYSDMYVKTADGVKKAENKLTVKNLLSMQGGFNYSIGGEIADKIKENPNASTSEIIKALAKRPLEFEPGEGYAYSLCYDVMGALIEKVCKVTYGEFLEKEIFAPLGMKDTGFKLKDSERLLPLYRYNKETKTADEITSEGNIYIFTPQYESGGAGLISTFEDYAEFVKTLANGGTASNGYKLLDRKSVEEIKANPMSEELLKNYDRYEQWGCYYGFSVRTLIDSSKASPNVTLGCFELTGAAGSYAVMDIENNISIVYFQHILDVDEVPDVVHHKIRDMVYDTLKGK